MLQQLGDHSPQIVPRRVGFRHDASDHRPARQLVKGEAEELQPELVEERHPALQVPAQHDGVRTLHQLAVADLIGVSRRLRRSRPPPQLGNFLPQRGQLCHDFDRHSRLVAHR